MKAAETSASIAIADCTPLTVVSRSSTTAEIETFISDVSMTNTNIAIASRSASLRSPVAISPAGVSTLMGFQHSHTARGKTTGRVRPGCDACPVATERLSRRAGPQRYALLLVTTVLSLGVQGIMPPGDVKQSW